jgi:hypothetical protein
MESVSEGVLYSAERDLVGSETFPIRNYGASDQCGISFQEVSYPPGERTSNLDISMNSKANLKIY